MRKFFLDVDPKMESASEIVNNTKVSIIKAGCGWDVASFSSYGKDTDGNPDWILDGAISLSDKELRALYHILTLKVEKEE